MKEKSTGLLLQCHPSSSSSTPTFFAILRKAWQKAKRREKKRV